MSFTETGVKFGSLSLFNDNTIFSGAGLITATVEYDGSFISNNADISISRTSNGRYEIDYSKLCFENNPTLTATPYSQEPYVVMLTIISITTKCAIIRINNSSGTNVNGKFNLIMIAQ